MTETLRIRPFQPEDQHELVRLWKRTGITRPWNDPLADIRRKQLVQPHWFLVGLRSHQSASPDLARGNASEQSEQVIASVMAGYDGHRANVYYLAVDPDYQRQGFGRQMLRHVEAALLEIGCPKINLMIRTDNLATVQFYDRLGYKQDAVVNLGKRLLDDEPDSVSASN